MTLALPEEIWQMIASYLKTRSLSACVLVCHELQRSFSPLLWRNVICNGSSGMIDLQTLRKHAPLIEAITISKFLPKGFGYIKLPKLKTLRLLDICKNVNDSMSGACLDMAVSLAVLVNRNPHIIHLEASFVNYELSNRFWKVLATTWAAPVSLSLERSKPLEAKGTNLLIKRKREAKGTDLLIKHKKEARELTLTQKRSREREGQEANGKEKKKKKKKRVVEEEKKKEKKEKEGKEVEEEEEEEEEEKEIEELDELCFWTACARFKELSLNFPDIPSFGSFGEQTLERVETLRLSKPSVRTINDQRQSELRLIRACPNLRHLCWDMKTSSFPTFGLTEGLRVKKWPFLTNLVFRNTPQLMDVGLQSILNLVPNPLTEFELHNSNSNAPGPLSFEVLQSRHFQSLERLSLKGCSGFTSKMAQSVLENSPKLEYFAADYICMNDVAQSPMPWVCESSLKELWIFFARQENQDHLDSLVFGMIASLRRLEKLDLSMDMINLPAYPKVIQESARLGRSLSLRLDAGLGQLENLKQLEYIGFDRTTQRLEKMDVGWMESTWRRLMTVSGKLSDDEERHKELAEMFSKRSVICPVQRFSYEYEKEEYGRYFEMEDADSDVEY